MHCPHEIWWNMGVSCKMSLELIHFIYIYIFQRFSLRNRPTDSRNPHLTPRTGKCFTDWESILICPVKFRSYHFCVAAIKAKIPSLAWPHAGCNVGGYQSVFVSREAFTNSAYLNTVQPVASWNQCLTTICESLYRVWHEVHDPFPRFQNWSKFLSSSDGAKKLSIFIHFPYWMGSQEATWSFLTACLDFKCGF